MSVQMQTQTKPTLNTTILTAIRDMIADPYRYDNYGVGICIYCEARHTAPHEATCPVDKILCSMGYIEDRLR